MKILFLFSLFGVIKKILTRCKNNIPLLKLFQKELLNSPRINRKIIIMISEFLYIDNL